MTSILKSINIQGGTLGVEGCLTASKNVDGLTLCLLS